MKGRCLEQCQAREVTADIVIIIVVIGEICHRQCCLLKSQKNEFPDMVFENLSFLLFRSKEKLAEVLKINVS